MFTHGEAMDDNRFSRSWYILFLLLFAIEIFPIWFFTFFPSHDGPSHVYNAYVLKTFFTGTPPRIAEYFKLNAFPFPNWSSHPFMAVCMLFVSPLIAHKLLLTVILVLFPLSIFYFFDAVKQQKSIYVILGFLFNYHFMLHYGFYNFSLSAPFYFFSLGYYWKHKDSFDVKKIVVLTALLLATYFCHMITFTILMCSMTLLVITANIKKPARLLQHLLGLLPFLIVMVAFTLQFSYGERREFFAKKHWMAYFFDIGSLVYYTDAHFFITRPLIAVGIVVFLITIFQIIFKKKSAEPGWHFLVIALFLASLYFILPWRLASGALLNDRVNFFIFLIILPFMTEDFSKRIKTFLVSFLVLACIGHIAITYRYYYFLDKGLKEFTSARHLIQPNSTVLALSSDWWSYETDVHYVEPFVQAVSYYCLNNGSVNLGNYEAQFDYFAVNWKKKHSGPIDYVIAWKLTSGGSIWSTDFEAGGWQNIDLHGLRRSLKTDYDLIYTSHGNRLKLYQHKNLRKQQG